MKKLMVVAAVAAMAASSFGAFCSITEADAHCFVWTFRANVKTLIPQKIKVTQGGAVCQIDETSTSCNYLVAGIRQFTGVAFDCLTGCPAGDIAHNEANGTAGEGEGVGIIIWENSSKLPVTNPLKRMKDGTVKYDVIPAADGSKVLFDRFGLYGTAVEAYYPFKLPGFSLPKGMAKYTYLLGAYGGDFTLAGFGAMPSQLPAANFQTINGYCVANWKPECGMVKYEFCTQLTDWCSEGDAATNVAGYGVWSLTYNDGLSRSESASIFTVVPARSQEVEDDGRLFPAT